MFFHNLEMWSLKRFFSVKYMYPFQNIIVLTIENISDANNRLWKG